MKKLLVLSLALGLTTAAMAEVIFFEDYESTTNNTDLIKSGAWGNAYGSAGEFKGVTCIEEEGGNHCAKMWGKAGIDYFWGAVIKFPEIKDLAATKDYKVSFKVKRESAEGNYGDGILFQLRGGKMPESKFRSGSDNFFFETCSNPNATSANTKPYGEWADFSIVYNAAVDASVIRSFSFDGVEQSNLNYKFGTSTKDSLKECYFFTAGFGDYAIYIDDFKVETVDAAAAPVVDVTGTDIYKFDSTDPITQTVSVMSANAEVDVEIDSEDNWLSFDDDSYAKTLDLKVGTPQTLTFKSSADKTVPSMPTAKVTYSYNDGTKDVTIVKYVYLQCGNSKEGWVLASSNFDEYEEGAVLKLTCTMWNDSDTMATVEEDPSDPVNQCVHFGGQGQFHMRLNMPATSYPDYDIRYSMKIRKCPDTEVNTYLGTWGNNLGEHYVNLFNDGTFQFKGWNDDNNKFTAANCLDKWVDLTFTFALGNMAEGRDALLKHVCINGVDQRVDIPKYIASNDTNYTYLRFYNWWHAYIDDLEVALVPANEIPEPAILGLLALVGLFLRRK